MTGLKGHTGNLFAVLIGIDYYAPNVLPDGGHYPCLGGCVRDIKDVENLLLSKLRLTGQQITKLTVSNPKEGEPPEPPEQWPTYENITGAFKQLTQKAHPGDQVYIHYSGHGGRTTTAFPELKGQNGLDESLVPTDIGTLGTRYVRDVELSHLLRTMVDKELLVTIVLDSCHSGGATRGMGGAVVRGIPSIDTTQRPTDSLVAERDELVASWRRAATSSRDVKLGSGWLPNAEGYVLLTACRANELANEYAFDGKERNGALTYWLLDSLNQITPEVTYRALHSRVLNKVHAKFSQQTPQIHGERDRVVFGTSRLDMPEAVDITKVDVERELVWLGTGQSQGVRKGSRFAIYPSGTIDFSRASDRLALTEVEQLQATESRARITHALKEVVTAGDRAVMIDVGPIRLKGRVCLVHQEDLPQGIDQYEAVEKAKRAIQLEGSGWVRLVGAGEESDFQVVTNVNGEYEIWDPSGRAIPNLRPALLITAPESPSLIAQRLVHLTKYRNVKLLDNVDPTSPLANKIEVEFIGMQSDYDPSERPEPRPFTEIGGTPTLRVGDWTFLRIKNSSTRDVNISVLNLKPGWGISLVYSPNIFAPGEEQVLPFQANLAAGYEEGVDVLKVFATAGDVNFRWLELPTLDVPPAMRGLTRSAFTNPLEEMLEAMAADKPSTRELNPASYPSREWASAQVEVLTQRSIEHLPRISHVRNRELSLLQSAFDEVIAEERKGMTSRDADARAVLLRPDRNNPIINEISSLCEQFDLDRFARETARDEATRTERGISDTAKYCGKLAAGMAAELWNAFFNGDKKRYNEYKAGLTKKFGDCDPNYAQALVRYVEFLSQNGRVPYRQCNSMDDFIIEERLSEDGTIAILADWGTGEPEALEVLRQVKQHYPQVVLHLGDIYYSGTEYEIENYFRRPWVEILQPKASGILSLALPGNHDLYAGGQPFYNLLDSFEQAASFFCLRNRYWQLIGMDTGLHDRLAEGPTRLEQSEADWLLDKVDNSDGRRTMLFSHHQLFSSYEKFDGKNYNEPLYTQLARVLPQIDLWLWGHEHDLIIFDEYKTLKRGRCVGGSAFPVGKYEMPDVPPNAEVSFNKQIALTKGSAFYQHCYAVIKFDGPKATVSYYEDTGGGRILFAEVI